jgi:hypothetical protein
VPSINLDHSQALAILKSSTRTASARGYSPSSAFQNDIEEIVTGSHLTYRYILVTGLLAKATNSVANPLSLQAGAALKGAYDARSLCHRVIVPHEPELLGNALGGSNEPYLNKPARFPQISLENAVRAGKDQRTLRTLYNLLRRITDSAQARTALQDALYFAIRRKRADVAAIKETVGELRGGRKAIRDFIEAFNSKSIHGETAALTVGALFWVMGLERDCDRNVQVHPTNESGASSNEISDVDVREGERLVFTAEVKDKPFITRDAMHALSKVKAAGLPCLHFIKGPRAEQTDGSDDELIQAAAREGVELLVLDLDQMADTIIAFAPQALTLQEFAERLSSFAESARAKADTFAHLKQVMLERS